MSQARVIQSNLVVNGIFRDLKFKFDHEGPPPKKINKIK